MGRQAWPGVDSKGRALWVLVAATVLVGLAWWGIRGADGDVLEPGLEPSDARPSASPSASPEAAVAEASEHRPEEAGPESARSLLFEVVDIERRGLVGWTVLSSEGAVEGEKQNAEVLGVTDDSGRLQILRDRIDQDPRYVAHRDGESPLSLHRQGARRFRAMLLPPDAAAVFVVRARDGHPVAGARIDLAARALPDHESPIDKFDSVMDPVVVEALAKAMVARGDRDAFHALRSTDEFGWCVVRDVPTRVRVEALASHWSHRPARGQVQCGGVTEIQLGPIEHALLRFEGDDWVRLDVGLGDDRLAWRQVHEGAEAALAERFPRCFPVTREGVPRRYLPYLEKSVTATVTWLRREEPEEFRLDWKPISGGPNFVTLRPRAPARDGVHAELEVRVVDAGGRRLAGVPLRIRGKDSLFEDDGLVDRPLFVRPGRYRVLLASARLRKLAVGTWQAHSCAGGQKTVAEVRLGEHMVPIRIRLVGEPAGGSQLIVKDANQGDVLHVACSSHQESPVHWVPAGRLNLVQVQRATVLSQQGYDLSQVRRDRPYEIEFRVR